MHTTFHVSFKIFSEIYSSLKFLPEFPRKLSNMNNYQIFSAIVIRNECESFGELGELFNNFASPITQYVLGGDIDGSTGASLWSMPVKLANEEKKRSK